MKILFATPYFEPASGFGGPVQSIGSLVAALRSAGAETVVLATDADGVLLRCVPRPGWKIRNGVRVHYARCRGFSKPSPVGRYFFAPAIARQLIDLVPEFDVLHLQGTWIFPTLAGSRIAALFDKPYVISLRGTLFPWAMQHKSFKKRVYMDLIEKKTLRGASRVHFTTMLEARLAEDTFPGLPAVVVPNTVETAPGNADPSPFRKNLEMENDTPLVVFLGRIHIIKGLELLVEAASEVVKEMPGTVFALVGDDEGGYAAVIHDMIARKGLERDVILPGPVRGEEKWSVFSAADVFVLPSHQENFGMAAAEAMSCGVPVVTSPLVGIAEDISEAGAGLVVERNPEMFARSILTLLRDAALRFRMGCAGRDLVARKYSPGVVAHSMLKLYAEVIEEHAPPPASWSARSTRTLFGWRGRREIR